MLDIALSTHLSHAFSNQILFQIRSGLLIYTSESYLISCFIAARFWSNITCDCNFSIFCASAYFGSFWQLLREVFCFFYSFNLCEWKENNLDCGKKIIISQKVRHIFQDVDILLILCQSRENFMIKLKCKPLSIPRDTADR